MFAKRFFPATASVSLMLACVLLVTRAQAKEPLPAGPDAYTQTRLAEDTLKYQLRILDMYQEHTGDPQHLRASARHLLLVDCKCELGLMTKEDRAKNFELGKKIVDGGSEDPLVLMATGSAAFQAQRPWQETINYFKLSEKAIPDSDYPAYAAALVWARTITYHTFIRQSLQNSRSRPGGVSVAPLIDALSSWIDEEDEDQENQRQLWLALERFRIPPSPSGADPLATIGWRDLLLKLEERDQHDTWTYQMISGKHLFTEGYRYIQFGTNRATGDELLRQAAKHFQAAWKTNPQVPESCDDLITLARDDFVKEEPRYWFDQCVAAQFDFQPAYTKYRTTLRPGHGGSLEHLLEFGWECAETQRYDTTVPFELMECLSAMEGLAGIDAQIYRQQGVFDAVHQLCKGSLASPVFAGQPQSDASRGWLRATDLAIGVRAQRLEDVNDLWEQVPEQQLQRAFQMYHITTPPQIARALGKAVSAIGPDLYDVQSEIEQVRDLRTAQSAQQALSNAIRDFEIRELAWCIYWQAGLDQMVRFYEGDWVDVTFFSELPRFLGLKQWKVEDKQTVLCTGPEALSLQWLSNLHSPLEFSVDISTINIPYASQLAGILVGEAATGFNRPHGRLFGINSKEGIAGAPQLGIPSVYYIKLKEVNHVEVQAWEGYWIFTINGVRVAKMSENFFGPNGNFVLWTPVPGPDTTIRYSNLRVRKIPYDPPPEKEEYEARRLYYTDRIDEDEENHNHYFDRAEACMGLEDYEQALKDYQRVAELRPDWIYGQLQLGALLARQGKYQEAMDIYQAMLKEKPDYHATLNHIAWLQATAEDEKFREPREAIRNANKARELDSRNKSYWTTQIAAYIAHKEYSNAADLMKRRMKFHDGQEEEILQQLQEAIDTEGEFHPYRE